MKEWIIKLGIDKFGPSAIRAGILALTGLLVAQAGFLATLGIIYEETSKTITIHLDTLEKGLLIVLVAVGGGLIKMLNHNAVKVLPGTNEAK